MYVDNLLPETPQSKNTRNMPKHLTKAQFIPRCRSEGINQKREAEQRNKQATTVQVSFNVKLTKHTNKKSENPPVFQAESSSLSKHAQSVSQFLLCEGQEPE